MFLLLTFAVIATGTADFLHGHLPSHDETHCSIQAALHAPTSDAQIVPILIGLGAFVAVLTELAQPLVKQRIPLRLDCRGPPARFLSI